LPRWSADGRGIAGPAVAAAAAPFTNVV
jgi:hypothetical protein